MSHLTGSWARISCAAYCLVCLSFGDSLAQGKPSGADELKAALIREKATLEQQTKEFNADCGIVSSRDRAKVDECSARHERLVAKRRKYNEDFAAFESRQAELNGVELAGRIRRIEVPPPIPPRDVAIGWGELAPGDELTRKVILGSEAGVAVLHIVGTIGGSALPARIILAVGKTVIAAEDAADVYLVRQNETYERALGYLRDGGTRLEFARIVRAVKEERPIGEHASVDMVRAARALLDPKLGNSGLRIAWDALFTPEAKRAALTQASIELGGEIVGGVVEQTMLRVLASQRPAYQAARTALVEAREALGRAQTVEAQAAVREAVKLANLKIAGTFRTFHPEARTIAHFESIFVKHSEEEYRGQK